MIASLIQAYIDFIEATFHIELQTFWSYFITLNTTLLALAALAWQTQHLYQQHARTESRN